MEMNYHNWEQSMEQNAHFESALSSMVSSPSNPPPSAADNGVIRELIGRLGSICNSDEISYLGGGGGNNNTSCYTTPLNSPPKTGLSWGNPPVSRNPVPPATAHLAALTADPGFAERAARFSCFGGQSLYGGLPETGKLSRVSSCISLKSGVLENGEDLGSQLEMDVRTKFGVQLSRSSTPECGEFGSAREESSVSDHVMMVAGGRNVRKRKAGSKGKAKEPIKVVDNDSNAKKSRSSETNMEQNCGGENSDGVQEQGKENSSKAPEPPKQDYIHVRARRGQATDSHSLAERVRREKISERMKFLQDLVPGCNKVTGKAIMLDEIINYVQSLQRQVEFLSMKLAVVNPRLDLNTDNLMLKDMHSSLPHSVFPVEASIPTFQFAQQPSHPQTGVANRLQSNCTVNHLDATLRRSMHMQSAALDGFGDAASLSGNLWEDDLQSFVQMGFGQNQEGAFSSQPFQGAMPTTHMKIEL